MGRTFTELGLKVMRGPALRLCLVGASGRLGGVIAAAATGLNATVSVALSSGDDLDDIDVPFDVVIDASRPDGTLRATELAVNKGVPIVVCTTGLLDAHDAVLRAAAKTVPVLRAPNTSRGVAVVRRMVEAIAAMTREWHVEITETHHKNKFDKPSGTATLFADSIDSARNVPMDRASIKSIREGDVIGDHVVKFMSADEVILIEHHALDRAVFGRGAVEAARWLVSQPPGLFTIEDSLQ